MALSPMLDMRQSQSLVMTPQLMQSIKLLQMTAMELEHFLDTELEKNPLLEREDSTNITLMEEDPTDKNTIFSDSQNIGQEKEDISTLLLSKTNKEDTLPFPNTAEISDLFDSSLENIYPDENQYQNNPMTLPSSAIKSQDWEDFPIKPLSFESFNLEQLVAEKHSLHHHIAEQIIFLPLNFQKKAIAFDLVGQLDETGYFLGSLEETAKRLNVAIEDVRTIFSKLQDFDPPGIFARDLQECLTLQLKRKNRFDPAIEKVLQNLPELAKRNFAYLAKICTLDQSELVEILEEIRTLNPKPGLIFTKETANYVVPEVVVRQMENGAYHVELNMAVLPKLVMHQEYSLKICRNADERGFLGECVQSAHWLLRALDQRAKTLLKVSGEIMRHQQDFLKFGISQLKPLNLATIAEAVGMHESTISRVTTNKYVATPRGTFEMRSFFSTALQSTQGEKTYAADAVKHRIFQLIDGETINNILSDDQLVKILKNENIDIARRTVAKYRESMNISSSVARRREKRARFDATNS